MKSIKQFITEAKNSNTPITDEHAISEIVSFVNDAIKCNNEKQFMVNCDKLLKYLQSVSRPASSCPIKPCAFIYISKQKYNENDVSCLKYMTFGNFTDLQYSPSIECYLHKFGDFELNKIITDPVTLIKHNIHEANFKEEFSFMKHNGYVFFVDTDIIENCYPEYYRNGHDGCVEKHKIIKREDYVNYINKLSDFSVNSSQQKSLKDRLDKSIRSIESCAISDITEIENIEDPEKLVCYKPIPK